MRGLRKATWGLVLWNVLMIGWTATYLGGIGECRETGWQLAVCEAGRSLGTEIGFPLIVGVWLVGIALGLVWVRRRTA